MVLTEFDQKILNYLHLDGAWIVRDIAGAIPLQAAGISTRQHSAQIAYRLTLMQHAGLVRPLDDKKPIAWLKV